MLHAILETAEGVKNVEDICLASPRMHGVSLGPADLAASRARQSARRSSRLVKPRATYGVSGVSSVRSSHAPHEYS